MKLIETVKNSALVQGAVAWFQNATTVDSHDCETPTLMEQLIQAQQDVAGYSAEAAMAEAELSAANALVDELVDILWEVPSDYWIGTEGPTRENAAEMLSAMVKELNWRNFQNFLMTAPVTESEPEPVVVPAKKTRKKKVAEVVETPKPRKKTVVKKLAKTPKSR